MSTQNGHHDATIQPFDTVVTLGPHKSCHERAATAYAAHCGMAARIELVMDLVEAVSSIPDRPGQILVQCSAHLNVHEVTERELGRVFIIDTFIYPTKDLALVRRKGVTSERGSLGLPRPCTGYLDMTEWPEVCFEVSKPVVTDGLLAGRYEYGLTHTEAALENPGTLEVVKRFGEVDTTWLVYAPYRRFSGHLLATSPAKEPAVGLPAGLRRRGKRA